MNRHRQTTIGALLLVALGPAQSRGAGFAINEHGAHALGMGNAVAAVADTPSALVFNPAGLARLEGLGLEAGISLVNPSFGYTLAVPGTSDEIDVRGEDRLFPVPTFFASYRVHDRVAAGVGLYSAFGLGVRWPATVDLPGESAPRAWWGRSLIQQIDLQTVSLAPTVALKLSDRVQLGAGLVVVQGAVSLRRAVTRSSQLEDDIGVELAADDTGFGANAGILVAAVPNLLDVGVAYRGGVSLAFTGQAAFSDVPVGLRAQLVDSSVRAAIDLPHVFAFGLAAFPTRELTVGMGFEVTTWSSYQRLALELFDQNGRRHDELSTAEVKDWRNTLTVRLGARYLVTPRVAARLGFAYDQSPVPDTTVSPELPDADRYQMSLGLGYRLGELAVDAAYMVLLTGDNDTAETAPLVGTYRAHAHVFALSLGYRLDI